MKYLLAGFRLFFFTIGASFYLLRYYSKVPFTGLDLKRILRLRQAFLKILLPVLGIQLQEYGKVSEGAGLYLSNHRSYLDPLILMARVQVLPVTKIEVKSWPFIGFFLKASGVLFVNRESLKSKLETLEQVAEFVRRGFGVLIYPEGTTHLQARTLPFKKGTFKKAVEISAKVYPIAIAYKHKEDAWVGDDTFFRHFFDRMGLPKMEVKISYGPCLEAEYIHELIEKTQTWIDQELDNLQKDWSDMAIERVKK